EPERGFEIGRPAREDRPGRATHQTGRRAQPPRRTDAARPRPPSRPTGHPPRGRPRTAARPPRRARSRAPGRAMGEGDARVGLEPRLAAVASTHEPRLLRVDASEPADPAQTPTLDEAGPQTRTGPALSHSPSKGAARSVSTRVTGPA